MVEENFKIGISLDLQSSSLADVQKAITKSISDAFSKGFQEGIKKMPAIPSGGTANIRSAKAAAGVTAGDFTKDLQRTLNASADEFGKVLKELSSQLRRLAKEVQALPNSGAAPQQGRAQRVLEGRARNISGLMSQEQTPAVQAEVTKQQQKMLALIQKQQQAQIAAASRNAKAEESAAAAAEKIAAAREVEAAAVERQAKAAQEAARQAEKAAKAAPPGGARVSKAAAAAEAKAAKEEARQAEKAAKAAAAAQAKAAQEAARQAEKAAKAAPPGGGAPPASGGTPPSGRKPTNYEAGARERAGAVSRTIEELKSAIKAVVPQATTDPDFFKRIGLEVSASVGEGAAVVIQQFGKEAMHVSSILKIVGTQLEGFSDVVTESAHALMKTEEGQARLAAVGRVARRSPQAGESFSRRLIKEIFEGLAPVQNELPLRGFQKGGEARLRLQLSQEQVNRLSALENDAQVIAAVNKELYVLDGRLSELGQSLQSLGMDIISSPGLSDETAAAATVIRGEPTERGKLGPIEAIEMNVQTRNLAGLGLGESGTVKPQRTFQPHQLAQIEGGGMPGIMGKGEQELYRSGLYKPGAFKEVSAAILDPGVFSEVFEDQWVFDPKLFQAPVREVKSIVVRNLAEGIREGALLAQDQIVGTRGEGEEATPVKFEMKGAEAKVKAVEKTFIDGIEGVRIIYEELNDTVTGIKITERAGIKGMGRSMPDWSEKMGLGGGIALGVSSRALAARGAIRPVIEMVANNISDVTGKGAQEIADAIVQAMQEGGKTLYEAMSQIAKQVGLQEIPGLREITKGPLAGQKVMTGRLSVGRLPDEGMKGLMNIEDRYLPAPAMQSLKLRADTERMALDMEENLRRITGGFSELRAELEALRGKTDVATEGLRKVMPEEFKRLPASAAKSTAELEGTILDPKYAQALALSVPTAEGGERLLRMSSIGKQAGQRETFTTAVGGIGFGSVSHIFDQIVEQAAKARAAMGMIPLEKGSAAFEEAANVTSMALSSQIAEISKLGVESEEGAAAAQAFLSKLMPVIDALGRGPAQIKYRAGGQERQIRRSSADYVKFLDEGMTKPRPIQQQMYAVQDVLGKRATGGGKIGSLGAVYTDVAALSKAMGALGIVLGKDSEAAKEAIARLEALELQLLKTLAEQNMAPKVKEPIKASALAAEEGGAGRGPIGTVIGFRTDISKELETAKFRLEQLAAAGADVSEALAAVNKMQELGAQIPGIPRDVVLINKNDWENLVKDTMKTRNVSRQEAESRLERPGLSMRWPVTGARSFTPARLQTVGDETLPQGKFGVGAPPAVTSGKDFAVIMKAFDAAIESTINRLKEIGGAGAEAVALREQLKALISESQVLVPVFKHTGQNMDIDGDKMVFFGDTIDSAGSGIKTFTQELAAGAIGMRGIYANIIGKQISKGGMGDIQTFSDYFAQVVKGRPAGAQSATMRPETREMAEVEAFAHVAGKKSVGLLSDMFNRMLLSVTAGTTRIGDAMETAIGAIMLGINESLAQKHGTGGATGPAQFLTALRKGQMQDIQKGLASGEGFLGKLGDIGEQIQKELRNRLYALGAGIEDGGAQALKEFASAQGIDVAKMLPKEITSGNFEQVIETIVDELGLDKLIGRMFTMMQNNAISALKKAGLTEEEMEVELKEMRVKGLDQKMILEAYFPGYEATRKNAQDQLKKLAPAEKADVVLKNLPNRIVEEAADMSDFSTEIDPKAIAAKLAAAISSWLETAKTQFTMVSQEALGGPGVLGKFIRGSQTKSGEEGRIGISERVVTTFTNALAALKSLAEGTAALDPSAIRDTTDALRKLGGVLGHEGVHKALKGRGDMVQRLSTSLESPKGQLGQNKEEIYAIAAQIDNVAEVVSKLEWLKGRKAAGITEETGISREQGATGEWKDVLKVKPIDEAIADWAKELNRRVIEELLAYRFEARIDPQRMANHPVMRLPQEVLAVLDQQLDKLASQRPEILRSTQDFATTLTTASNTIISAMEASAQVGPAPMREASSNRIVALTGDYPGAPAVTGARNLLGAHEKAIEEGSSNFKLRGFERKGGRLTYGQSGGQIPFADRLGSIADEIQSVQQSLSVGLPPPEELQDLSRRIRRAAMGMRSKLSYLKKQGAISGVDPQEEYMRVMREFRAAVSVQLANEARALDDQIAQALGEEGTLGISEFRDLVERFQQKVVQLHEWAASTLAVEGRGKGTVASYLATGQGELLQSAKEAGVGPTSDTFAAVFQNVAGEGQEATDFLSRMKTPILDTVRALSEGVDPLQVWNTLFTKMMQHPEEMRTDLVKVVEILSKFSRILGFNEGQFSEMATSMATVTDKAKRIRDELKKGTPIKSREDILSLTATAPKQARESLAAGLGGSLEQSVEAQYDNLEAIVENRRKQLEKVIQLPSYKATGAAGKVFEPISMEIKDPESGQVIQKMTANFVRFGSTVKAQMSQAGAAVNSFGNQFRNALRRVVQWGFASGIIYGTIRALRSMADTTVVVQNKMLELKKVMDTSITNFDAMQNSASDMARGFGVAIEEVIDGMVVYGQQGLATNEIMERTKASILAVNVTTLTSVQATDALTAAHKIFGDEVNSSLGFVDAWAAVAAKHAISAEDLAIAVQRSGSAAKTAGVSFEDYMGMVTAIGSVTRQTGKEVATGTKFMFQSMRRPTAQKELMSTGIVSQNAEGEFRPAMDVLGDVAGKWDELSRAQQLSIAQAVAGVRHYNQFIVMMENWEEVLDASANAANSQGYATRKNAIVMESFGKQMQVLREEIKRLSLDVGKAVLPIMTMLVKSVGVLVNVLNMVPEPLKQLAVLGAGGFVVFHKSANLIVDTMSSLIGETEMFGGTLKEAFSKQGLIRGMATALGKIPEIMKSAGSGLMAGAQLLPGMGGMKKAMTLPAIDIPIGEVPNIMESVESMGFLSKAAYRLRAGFLVAAGGSKILAVGLAGLTFAPVAIGIGLLVKSFMDYSKTGKDVEDEMFDMVGKSEDLTRQLQSQASQIGKVAHLWDKYQSAVATSADPGKRETALEAGTYKSPLNALKQYQDSVATTRGALAKMDSTLVQGMTGSGEYIVGLSDGFKNIAISAADAQKAATAALKTDIIAAYAEDLKKASSWWGKLIGWTPLGKLIDLSDTKKLADTREQIQKLAEERQRLAEQGMPTIHLQGEMNDLVGREAELRAGVTEKAMELKRVLEEMPTFESADMAATVYNNPKLRKSFEDSVAAGAFGREATPGSARFSRFAQSTGAGGMLGYEDTTNPIRLLETLLEKGVAAAPASQLSQTKGGGLAQIGPETAKQLLAVSTSMEAVNSAAAKSPGMIAESQTLISSIDDFTGEVSYHFLNGVTGMIEEISQADLNELLTKAGEKAVSVDRSAIEEAAEQSRRLLTLQYTGALAGIRDPGQVNFGPGMARELTTEQRVFRDLPDQMQRLAEVQKEMGQAQEVYNESLSEGADAAEESARGMSQNSRNIKALDSAAKELTMALQMEGFDLTVLGNYNSALQKLSQTMEQAAVAARDARIEEETRAELLKHTSGAMAGLGVVPSIDFGKSMRELTSEERLQKDMGPGFTESLQRIASVEGRYERGIQTVVDIRKQMADFGEMVQDLSGARGKLKQEQAEIRAGASQKGIDEGSFAVAEQIQESSSQQLSELQAQTPVLADMRQILQGILEVSSLAPEEKQGAISKKLSEMTMDQLLKTVGKAGPSAMDKFYESVLGMNRNTQAAGIPMGPGMVNVTGERKEMFDRLRTELDAAIGDVERARELKTTPRGVVLPSRREDEAMKQLSVKQGELMQIPEVRAATEEWMKQLSIQTETAEKATKAQESANKDQILLAQIEEMRAGLLSAMSSTEQTMMADTEKAAQILKAKEGYRLAIAAQGFATAIEQQIQDFKKAELLFYEKEASDLEGPFARVGQPGFKTTFEQRREEIDNRRFGGPRSMDQMRQDAKDLEAVKFDEKEATIKQEQDKEVAALRQQQSQAETLRTTIADALMGGDLAGTPEMESMAKRYLETLTGQLTESEQADMGAGGELSFKGVPALEDASRFLAQINESVKEQARKAQGELNKAYITDPIVAAQQATTIATQGVADAVNSLGQRLMGKGAAGNLVGATAEGFVSAAGAKPLAGVAPASPIAMAEENRRRLEAEKQRLMGGTPAAPATGIETLRPSPGAANTGMAVYDKFMGDMMSSMRAASTEAAKGPDYTGLSRGEAVTAQKGITDLDYVIGMLKEISTGGGQVMTPGGNFKDTTGTVSFTDRPDSPLGAVGLSNYNRAMESKMGLQYGNRALTSGAVLTDTSTNNTPGAENADKIQREAAAGNGTGSQTEAIEGLGEQLTALIEAVTKMAETPDQGSSEVVAAIEASGSAITEALGTTLNVNVENSNIPVTVEGLEEALAGAFGGSGLGAVGAEVADARLRLQTLESIIDPDGPTVEERIATATSELEARLEEVAAPLIDLEITLDEIRTVSEKASTDASTASEAVGDLQKSLESLLVSMDSQRQNLETQIRQVGEPMALLSSRVANTEGLVTQIRGKVESALATAQQALNQSRQR